MANTAGYDISVSWQVRCILCHAWLCANRISKNTRRNSARHITAVFGLFFRVGPAPWPRVLTSLYLFLCFVPKRGILATLFMTRSMGHFDALCSTKPFRAIYRDVASAIASNPPAPEHYLIQTSPAKSVQFEVVSYCFRKTLMIDTSPHTEWLSQYGAVDLLVRDFLDFCGVVKQDYMLKPLRHMLNDFVAFSENDPLDFEFEQTSRQLSPWIAASKLGSIKKTKLDAYRLQVDELVKGIREKITEQSNYFKGSDKCLRLRLLGMDIHGHAMAAAKRAVMRNVRHGNDGKGGVYRRIHSVLLGEYRDYLSYSVKEKNDV